MMRAMLSGAMRQTSALLSRVPTWRTVAGKVLLALYLLPLAPAHGQIIGMTALDQIGNGANRGWIDVDGDGRDDFCVPSGTTLYCQLSKQGQFEAWTKTSVFGTESGFMNGRYQWADINGDGFVDLCATKHLGGSSVYSMRIVCRAGPGFGSTILSRDYVTSGETGDGNNSPIVFVPGIGDNWSTVVPRWGDVNGDGLQDFCYFYLLSGAVTGNEFRCELGKLTGSTFTLEAVSTAWTMTGVQLSQESGWPQGFYDFNGDGMADYCRIVPNTNPNCILGGASGFMGHLQAPAAMAMPIKEGSAFIDANSDGKTDFCRLDNYNGNRLRCTLSNGVKWEWSNSLNNGRDALDRVSQPLSDMGHQYARWWADVNGDGYPDFCRGQGSVDPVGTGDKNITSNVLCRLGRGDYGDGTGYTLAFAESDITLSAVNLGRGDGGRNFCDPHGNGLQTLCRVTTSYAPGEEECFEQGDTGVPFCYTLPVGTKGLLAGLSDDQQAQPAQLSSFSDGVGAETRVTYMNLTSPEVYSRSNTTTNTNLRALLTVPRSSVVFETRAWEQTGDDTGRPLTGHARYMYRDLRVDPKAGSRGFRERWIFHEGLNTLEHVMFFQALGPTVDATSVLDDPREVGAVLCQERFVVQNGLIPTEPPPPAESPGDAVLSGRASMVRKVMKKALSASVVSTPSGGVPTGSCGLPSSDPSSATPFVLVQNTTNQLSNTTPNNPRYRFTGSTVVNSWDWDGQTLVRLPDSTTTTTMDDMGNVTLLQQNTHDLDNGLQWAKTTTSTYLAHDFDNWILGRLKTTKVVASAPTVAQQAAAYPRNVGNAGDPNAAAMSPAQPVPTPIPPAALAAILQLLLGDD